MTNVFVMSITSSADARKGGIILEEYEPKLTGGFDHEEKHFKGMPVDGLNLVMIDGYDGTLHKQSYLIAKSGGLVDHQTDESLPEIVERLRFGTIVLAAAHGKVQLSARDRVALSDLGSSHITDLDIQSRWAMVGAKGMPRGAAAERTGAEPVVTLLHELAFKKLPDKACRIDIVSIGGSEGGCDLKIDAGPSEGCFIRSGPGLYVAALGSRDCDLKGSWQFDATLESPQDVQAFLECLRTIPDGLIVAMAADGDASGWARCSRVDSRAKTTEAIDEIERLGSSHFRYLERNTAWVFVARKGDAQPLLEAVAQTGKLSRSITVAPSRPLDIELVVEASGRSTILVGNGVISQCMPQGNMLNVDFLHPLQATKISDCRVGKEESFATLGSAFESVSEKVPRIPEFGDQPSSLVIVSGQAVPTEPLPSFIRLWPSGAPPNAQPWAAIGWLNGPRESAFTVEKMRAPFALRVRTTVALALVPHFRVLVTSAPQNQDCQITVDGLNVATDKQFADGLNVAVFDPDIGYVHSFYCFGPEQAKEFQSFLTGVPIGCIVAVSARGEIDPFNQSALRLIGSSDCPGWRRGLGFALIGVRGAPPGSALESALCAAVAVGTAFPISSIAARTHPMRVEAHSFGHEDSGETCILIDGRVAEFPNGVGRGLNVLVFDDSGREILAETFDTHGSPTAATDLRAFVEGVPPELYLAIVAFDDTAGSGAKIIRPALAEVLNGLGATLGDKIGYRSSYALIVSRKGEVIAESLAEAGKGGARAIAWVEPDTGPNPAHVLSIANRYDHRLAATIYNSNEQIAVQDGISILSFLPDYSMGDRYNFPCDSPESTKQAISYLESIPAGDVVAIVGQGQLKFGLATERARLARVLETFGASPGFAALGRRSWSLIGTKGASPGLAVESVDGDGAGSCGIILRIASPELGTKALPAAIASKPRHRLLLQSSGSLTLTRIGDPESHIVKNATSKPLAQPFLRVVTKSPSPVPLTLRAQKTLLTSPLKQAADAAITRGVATQASKDIVQITSRSVAGVATRQISAQVTRQVGTEVAVRAIGGVALRVAGRAVAAAVPGVGWAILAVWTAYDVISLAKSAGWFDKKVYGHSVVTGDEIDDAPIYPVTRSSTRLHVAPSSPKSQLSKFNLGGEIWSGFVKRAPQIQHKPTTELATKIKAIIEDSCDELISEDGPKRRKRKVSVKVIFITALHFDSKYPATSVWEDRRFLAQLSVLLRVKFPFCRLRISADYLYVDKTLLARPRAATRDNIRKSFSSAERSEIVYVKYVGAFEFNTIFAHDGRALGDVATTDFSSGRVAMPATEFLKPLRDLRSKGVEVNSDFYSINMVKN